MLNLILSKQPLLTILIFGLISYHVFAENLTKEEIKEYLTKNGIKTRYISQDKDGTFRLDLGREHDKKSPNIDLSKLKNLPIAELNLWETKITNIDALNTIPLKKIDLGGTDVTDLKEISNLPLESLDIFRTKITDLSEIKDMPLKALNIFKTDIKDLSPVKNMPLERLVISHTKITDLTPLKGKKLTAFTFSPEKITNGIPIIEKMESLRFINGKQVEEFWHEYALKNKPDSVFPRTEIEKILINAGIKIDKKDTISIVDRKGIFSIYIYGQKVDNLNFLKGLPIERLTLNKTGVSSLAGIEELPLKVLNIMRENIVDISPVKKMKLEYFLAAWTKVSDITPLKGMPLKTLYISFSEVKDLSPIKGMPLTTLYIDHTKITDISPIKGMQLEQISLSPEKIEKGWDPLREIKTLKNINIGGDGCYDMNPKAFWNAFDSGRFSNKGKNIQKEL